MTTLPPLGPGVLPVGLREAPAAAQREYRAALGFERVLLGQLAQTLTENATGDGGAPQAYRDMLPDALADGLLAAGGIGLARTLVSPQTAQQAAKS
jgi:Rod binding domain-containing protein